MEHGDERLGHAGSFPRVVMHLSHCKILGSFHLDHLLSVFPAAK